MADSYSRLTLGSTLRALRHHADLSQRELAKRAGVPASTVARIESGRAEDPKFRTIERLVQAAGGLLTVGGAGADETAPLPTNPNESLRDEAGRNYPAHLDVREVREPSDWWGAWWLHTYTGAPSGWPTKPPNWTYDLDRETRDRRRQREAARQRAEHVRIVRVMGRWQWMARTPTDRAVGVLRAYPKNGEIVLGPVEVADGWRQAGIGRRLVEALKEEMALRGIVRARAVVDRSDAWAFLATCGFQRDWPQPIGLTLSLPAPTPRR